MNRSTKQLTVSALLFALGLVLPFLTGQVPQIGNMLLPMHFPVFLWVFMNRSTKQLTVSALLFALGLVLPFLTGQVPQIGNMLLPMHFPVFLCGWQYALFLGFLLPICRSMIFGMPHMFPVAIAMAFELAAYGLIAGLIYGHSKQKSTASLYIALISRLSAAHLPQHDLRHATHVPRCHCHGI